MSLLAALPDPLALLADRYTAPADDAAPGWRDLARPEQLPPDGDWQTWLILAGRGWGKTRTGAEYVADLARTHPGARIALVAITFADGRDTMVEGESGLLEVLDDEELRGGTRDGAWNRSLGELFLANGSRFKIYSSERPRQLRGPQHHFAWCDEAAAWIDAHKGTAKDTTWSNLKFGLRLPGRPGWPSDYRTRIVVTTTPRFLPLLKVPDTVLAREPHRAGIAQAPSTRITRGRTDDNLANLTEEYRREVIDPLRGTELARQELDAEIIEDVDGALLTRDLVNATNVLIGEVPTLAATVVTVDPATTENDTSDETGIVAVAADHNGEGYILADRSMRGSPDSWGRAVWSLVHDVGGQAVVVEDNQGGDMVEHVLTTTWQLLATEASRRGKNPGPRPPIVRVHPTGKGQGKWIRAQPMRAKWQQKGIHVVIDDRTGDTCAELVDQACTWTGDPGQDSPDRVDAMVHGLNWLLFPGTRTEKGGKSRMPAPRRWHTGAGRR